MNGRRPLKPMYKIDRADVMSNQRLAVLISVAISNSYPPVVGNGAEYCCLSNNMER